MATPGRQTLRYGGNTSCVEVFDSMAREQTSLIFDAGTGICAYGDDALRRGQRVFRIFLSHTHYDHIIGLTKFLPLFREDCEIHFFGESKGGLTLEDVLRRFFAHPFFPVAWAQLPNHSRFHIHTIEAQQELIVASQRVKSHSLHHPQGALAFRVFGGEPETSLVYATDHEHGTESDARLVEFISGTELFIFDSTYDDASYLHHRGWGHSTALAGARIASAAEAKSYGLFHHDPLSDDEQLEKRLLPEAKAVFPASFLCREGSLIQLDRPLRPLARKR